MEACSADSIFLAAASVSWSIRHEGPRWAISWTFSSALAMLSFRGFTSMSVLASGDVVSPSSAKASEWPFLLSSATLARISSAPFNLVGLSPRDARTKAC
jgi:hypothetical protein